MNGTETAPVAKQLSLREVREIIGVSDFTLRQMIRHQGLPVWSAGGRRRFVDPAKLRAWIDARTAATEGAMSP